MSSASLRPPSLQVALQHRIGVLSLRVAFTLTHPWTVLFAPSGAGKSTILRILAGLIQPDAARIVRGGGHTSSSPESCVLTDTATGIFVPPHRRGTPMVAQHPALFPHKTVLQNVLYGTQTSKTMLHDVQARSDPQTLLDACRIAHLCAKRPVQLSGGESQRVAVARALGAVGTRILLLDEPFTGLGTAVRDELAREVKAFTTARSIPVLHVTHDVGEIFAVADEVIRLEDGHVVAQGTPAATLREERERLLASLL